ncbi:MAG: MotA/TolQ/ExbB proton channel family protein [Thermoguttaceae bacterium]|nr:MotA/TolQ/ExbB proton channel family protein [Thermoguttaceae bacterium]MDW8036729.1 MotA/TolQ/ExbB proton channel family protein [Thermoguttaceae bacterium]
METGTLTTVVRYAGNACYGALAVVALWGVFCVILAWRRISQVRFRTEAEQGAFLDQLEQTLQQQGLQAAVQLCENDERAVPQLAYLALVNRKLGLTKIQALLVDRFRRDVLADLEYRLSWVYTMIKSAPMLGLYGTVLGMMGAFGQLSAGQKVDPTKLAENISLALVTTALGLTIAIPLILCAAALSLRIRKLEDLVGYGLTRLLEILKTIWGPETTSPK